MTIFSLTVYLEITPKRDKGSVPSCEIWWPSPRSVSRSTVVLRILRLTINRRFITGGMVGSSAPNYSSILMLDHQRTWFSIPLVR